ncbi:hypothetical protein [Deinococcus wulumuqiensis]|uniref:hypothetical protein n=1 Tax=Deinococcus wulumuqiensis TaxID=980427 RepID=UPI001967BB9B|nr:hypothetical protein [Deinococcus wulumuqiensis]
MSRVLLFVLGVLLLCAAALAALWAAGQVLVALGALLTGAAGVLGRLLIFLVLGAGAGGVSYFVASAWRPGQPVPSQPVPSQPVPGQPVPGQPVPTPGPFGTGPAGAPAPPPAAARSPRWLRGKRAVVAPSPVAAAEVPAAESLSAGTPTTQTAVSETAVSERADRTLVITAAPQVSPMPPEGEVPTPGEKAPAPSEPLTPDDSATDNPRPPS